MGKKEEITKLSETEEITSNEEEKQKVNEEPVEEQKKYVQRKESYINDIKRLEEENIELNKKAEEIEHTVNTFCLESIYGMENFIKQAIKTYTDRNDIKEIKNEIKNLETVFAFETLLNEYKTLASEHRANITANDNDIKNYKETIEELEEKITSFQKKLPI